MTTGYEDRVETATQIAIENVKRNAYDTVDACVDGYGNQNNQTKIKDLIMEDVMDAIHDACYGKQNYIDEIIDNELEDIIEVATIEFYEYLKQQLN
jgi:hypothetical protein